MLNARFSTLVLDEVHKDAGVAMTALRCQYRYRCYVLSVAFRTLPNLSHGLFLYELV